MTDPAGVGELGDDAPAVLVDRVGHTAPPFDLVSGVEPGGQDVALPDGTGLDALADDQTGAGALPVVLGGQCGDDPVRSRGLRVIGAINRRFGSCSFPIWIGSKRLVTGVSLDA